jgi:hypothetical protein
VKSLINKLFSKTAITSLLLPFLAVGGAVNADDGSQDIAVSNTDEMVTAPAASKEPLNSSVSQMIEEGASAILEGKIPDDGLDHCITVETEDGQKKVLSCPPVAPRPEGQ